MAALIVLAGLALILVVLHDGFEVILLPRRVSRGFRITRLFYISSWRLWRFAASRAGTGKRRLVLLSWFGPSSILMLFLIWAAGLILGFGLIHRALGTPMTPAGARLGFSDYLYFSGVTFFTLGFGDIAPIAPPGRALAVAEAGVGFAFLAVVISYLPVFYQAFSGREISISLLDARAGSPPRASSILIRLAPTRNFEALDRFLQEWERWSAEVLESHLSFPLLSYYRSQHDNQSWLAAITAILDTCALVIAGIKGADPYQAQLTFAMARHTVVDLAQVFRVRPADLDDRLPPGSLASLLEELELAGLDIREGETIGARLGELRKAYEPFVAALSAHLLMPLPPIWSDAPTVDNWQTSAWMKRTNGIGKLAIVEAPDDHDD